jgi:hypothetical protein
VIIRRPGHPAGDAPAVAAEPIAGRDAPFLQGEWVPAGDGPEMHGTRASHLRTPGPSPP